MKSDQIRTLYIPRTLTDLGKRADEVDSIIDESSLAAYDGPQIVLGEPGIGKSRLLEVLASLPGFRHASAAAWIYEHDPRNLLESGDTLVIDALDEVPGHDAFSRVIGKLSAAGLPRFVLSCRAADWNDACAIKDIGARYGTRLRCLALNGLKKNDALQYLAAQLGPARASKVIHQLESHRLSDFYENPLNLELLAVVDSDALPLPSTRAALFERAVEVLRVEANDRHRLSDLSKLDRHQSLSAAGAICAALVLGGYECISHGVSRPGTPRQLCVAELSSFPGGAEARVLLKSRLFVLARDESKTLKPMHRAIAEFLGARWLALAAKRAPDVRVRILSLLIVNGGVVASLRGICAWLPYFDIASTNEVVGADAYALLRYGEADALGVDQARVLLSALVRLQERDPLFRAEDRYGSISRGLAREELREELAAILSSPKHCFHLRSLVLESLRDSSVANTLLPWLFRIIGGQPARVLSFDERMCAIEVLMDATPDEFDWTALVEQLSVARDDDSKRLALTTMSSLGFSLFTPVQIADTIARRMRLMPSPDGDSWNDDDDDQDVVPLGMHVAHERIPDWQIDGLLDQLIRRVRVAVPSPDVGLRYEFCSLIAHLVERRVVIGPVDVSKLVDWLEWAHGGFHTHAAAQDVLDLHFGGSDTLRRDVQKELLLARKKVDGIWHLEKLHRSLALREEDALFFLRYLGKQKHSTQQEEKLWRWLVILSCTNGWNGARLRKAALAFAGTDPERFAFVESAAQPRPKDHFEIEHEQRVRAEARKLAAARTKVKRAYRSRTAELQCGEIPWIVNPARAYLGLFRDLDNTLPAQDRIGNWLGAALQRAALRGLATVLSREDLPSAADVGVSLATRQPLQHIYPILAGALERQRMGLGLGELTDETILTLAIASEHELRRQREPDQRVLRDAIECELARRPHIQRRFLRLLVEPQLAASCEHVIGLEILEKRRPIPQEIAALAKEWLLAHPRPVFDVEERLVDVLACGPDRALLASVLAERRRDACDDGQRSMLWESVGLLVDFEVTRHRLGAVDELNKQLLWQVARRFGGGRQDNRTSVAVEPRQLAWAIQRFRRCWPCVERPSTTVGITNAWDAAAHLCSFIERLAEATDDEAVAGLVSLLRDDSDGYTTRLQIAAQKQSRRRRDLSYRPITLDTLHAVVENSAPQTTRDLLAVVRLAIDAFQAEIRGSDTDVYEKYFRNCDEPHTEDYCTNRLIEDIDRHLVPRGIDRIPQRSMALRKISDFTITCVPRIELPVEAKGQWNRELWDAPLVQLRDKYASDHRSDGLGLFLVYWFGQAVIPIRRFRARRGASRPIRTANDLRSALEENIPPEDRNRIHVIVIDFSAASVMASPPRGKSRRNSNSNRQGSGKNPIT